MRKICKNLSWTSAHRCHCLIIFKNSESVRKKYIQKASRCREIFNAISRYVEEWRSKGEKKVRNVLAPVGCIYKRINARVFKNTLRSLYSFPHEVINRFLFEFKWELVAKLDPQFSRSFDLLFFLLLPNWPLVWTISSNHQYWSFREHLMMCQLRPRN